MEHTFHGFNRFQLNEVLNFLIELEDRIDLTEEEEIYYRVATHCVTQIMNRMADGKQINWD